MEATVSPQESRFNAGQRAMFVTKVLARLTVFAGLMALQNAVPISVLAQQVVTVGATDIGGTACAPL